MLGTGSELAKHLIKVYKLDGVSVKEGKKRTTLNKQIKKPIHKSN